MYSANCVSSTLYFDGIFLWLAYSINISNLHVIHNHLYYLRFALLFMAEKRKTVYY